MYFTSQGGYLSIDTHCHLGENYREVLKRAKEAGVTHVVNICIHPTDIVRAEKIVEEFNFAPFAAGIHPCHAHEVEEGHFETICDLAQRGKLVAIGESGLDLYHSQSHFEIQKRYFLKHIQLANRQELALSIHCRNAYPELQEILEEHPVKRGILHCFAGSYAIAKWAIQKGYSLSISGVVTFKNAKELQEIVANAPLESLLVETDAPYLAPDPYRGKTNEPSYLPLIVKKIAELHQKPIEQIEEILTVNSKKLFSLK